MNKTITAGNLLLAFLGFLFLTCFSVTLVLNCKALYYFDIEFLQIEEESGYTEEVIRENYDALIAYNQIWSGESALCFPSFPMSEEAAIHFQEVRRIFFFVQYATLVLGALFFGGLWRKGRKKDFGSLRLLPALTVALPLGLGLLIAGNWERFFTAFHELFFDNDYWLFNPATDPVILILPDAFFAHCAVAILLLLFLLGGLGGLIGWKQMQKERCRNGFGNEKERKDRR